MVTEITLNTSYRAACGYAGTYSVDTTYQEVHNKQESNYAFGNPSGLLIMQDSWFPTDSYPRYNIHRSFLYWNIPILPEGAKITKAEIKLYINNNYTHRAHKIIVQNGQPTFPSNPIYKSSYYYAFYSGNGGEISSDEITINAWNTITLNETGIGWINTGGETKFCIRVNRDIESDSPGNPIEGEPAREEGIHLTGDPIDGIYAKLIITYSIPEIINKKVEPDSTQTAMKLYGEIIEGLNIIERGFEYKIQEGEPGAEDIGIEVIDEKPSYIEYWDIGEYHVYEYKGNNVDFWDRLYNQKENTIWWFRAYFKDDASNKCKAVTWMKNVPTVLTYECTEVYAQEGKANGELLDIGANIVTRRGFRIIKEYEGDLQGISEYDSPISDWILDGEIEEETLINETDGSIIGYVWRGIFYRDSLDENDIGYELGVYEKILGGGISGEGFGFYLKSNDNYKIKAIAINSLGMGFGEEVDLATGQIILPGDDENVSEISADKTITIGTIPYGATVTRIGIRLGRTMGCNEIHVFEDGSWGTGGSVTFHITDFVPGETYYKMPYIVINYGDWEEEVKAIPDYRNPDRLEEWLNDYPIEVFPDVKEEDEDELDQTVTDSSVGDISYRTIIREIKCERIADQSFIDKAGRRRSKTINNHLIQTRGNCKIIINDYLGKFQIVKLKILIDYDIPIPFEREDTILLGDGKTKYRADGEGLIAFKADGEGELLQQDFILAKLRKMDCRNTSGTEAMINLELEV